MGDLMLPSLASGKPIPTEARISFKVSVEWKQAVFMCGQLLHATDTLRLHTTTEGLVPMLELVSCTLSYDTFVWRPPIPQQIYDEWERVGTMHYQVRVSSSLSRS